MQSQQKKSVLLALSGGVDSAVAGAVLKEQGYNVKAVFFKLYSDTKDPFTGQCSYLKDLAMARKVAIHLGIPLTVIDKEQTYKTKVLAPMYRAFKKGKTPNPDLPCNTLIKFPLLHKEAIKQNCQHIATGHYARFTKGTLYQAKDKRKDQTYFLAQVPAKYFKNCIFPLANLTKEQVRQKAQQLKLPNWNRESTAGICFIQGIPFQQFITQKIPSKKGIIRDWKGNSIGTHQGSHQYTIGQHIAVRKPQGIQAKWFVAKKQGTTLIAVPEGHPLLYTKKLQLTKIRSLTGKPFPSTITVKIRYRSPLQHATLKGNTLTMAQPQTGIAPGQYVVFYKNKQCLGSAEIA